MRLVIERIDALSAGKIMGLINFVMGLFYGIVMALLFLVGGIAMFPVFSDNLSQWGSPWQSGPGMMGGGIEPAQSAVATAGAAIGAIIILPLVYGIGGFIVGFLISVLYNVFAAWVGGVKVTTKEGRGGGGKG